MVPVGNEGGRAKVVPKYRQRGHRSCGSCKIELWTTSYKACRNMDIRIGEHFLQGFA